MLWSQADVRGCGQTQWKPSPVPVAPTEGQPLGAVCSRDYDPVGRERRAPSRAQATVKSERGSFKNAGVQLDAGAHRQLDRENLPIWVQEEGKEMAHEVNLDSLKELEREVILQVLYRDQAVQNVEEERIRKVKIKTGEWFFEERAKKFPTEGKRETAGAKLLQSYQKLSTISVVPPTPPPVSESQCSGSPGGLQELGQFKGFNKSMENLFLSVATHMKKLSKSQNDMTSEKRLLATGPRQCSGQMERRSQSDTAVDIATRKVSIPDILKFLRQEDPKHSTGSVLKQQTLPSISTPTTLFSGGLRHGSIISINSTCTEMGNFDNANVTGEIEFSIRYCFKTHCLEICISTCKNLAYGEEKKKKCNPYVKTYLLPDRSSQGKRKTGVQKNTLDPTFQETLKYQVDPAQLVTRQLLVSVWHLGTLARRVFLGEVIVPLATWDFEDNATQSFCWYPLRAKAEKYEANVPQNNGELAVRAKLVLPAEPRKLQEAQEGDQLSLNGQLCLVVLGAKNLPVRSDGTLNSFVKGCLTLPDQQKLRLKSPVLKKQACPQWKHSFVFNGVTRSQLRQASLELTVWDQAVFGMNDRLLGGARLGSKGDASGTDSCSQSKLQWQKVLSSPNLWTDMTLILH
ncbi:PREDICTED: synaptotagmin-like protein 3 isoform X4 [Chinchilla lanigera]|uniref:synaptotagmin-like protein 3 isoform X4 n=1 Tax=Chinchilla lanigera TaxID=34839 RepID=UPI0006986E75|nr:PREDICTED: synaptotagmin-like protein 3 isoform X4 [Chinchilla lanigera]